MARRKVNYVTSGRNWAWGWHRYEAQSIISLLTIVILLAVGGLIMGIIVGATKHTPTALTLAIVLGSVIVATVVGLGLAKAFVKLIWSLAVTKEGDD